MFIPRFVGSVAMAVAIGTSMLMCFEHLEVRRGAGVGFFRSSKNLMYNAVASAMCIVRFSEMNDGTCRGRLRRWTRCSCSSRLLTSLQ